MSLRGRDEREGITNIGRGKQRPYGWLAEVGAKVAYSAAQALAQVSGRPLAPLGLLPWGKQALRTATGKTIVSPGAI